MKNTTTQLKNVLINKAIFVTAVVLFTLSTGSALASAPTVTTNGATSITSSFARINGYVSAGDNNPPVIMWFEWGTSSSFGNTSTIEKRWHGGGYPISRPLDNLTANTTYYYRVAAQDGAGTNYGETWSFSTTDGSNGSSTNTSGGTNSGSTGTNTSNNSNNTGRTPIVSTTYATNVSTNGVSLNGYVDPNGATNAYRWFEWGSTQSLGNISGYTYAGSMANNFSQGISGLQNNTTYYFRAVAQSNAGTVNGSIYSFTTGVNNLSSSNVPPVIVIKTPSYIGSQSAQLNASIIKGGSAIANGYFEWGQSADSLTGATPSQPLQSSASVNMSATIGNLKSDTTYFARAVVQDSTSATYRSQVIAFQTSTNDVAGAGGTVNAGGNGNTSHPTSNGVTAPAASPEKDTKNSASGIGAAGVVFAKTSMALIGWFLSIILFIIVVILIIMLRRCGKKDNNEDPTEAYKEFPETAHAALK